MDPISARAEQKSERTGALRVSARRIFAVIGVGWLISQCVTRWLGQPLLMLPWDLGLFLVITWVRGRWLGWACLCSYWGLTWFFMQDPLRLPESTPSVISHAVIGVWLILGLDELRRRWNQAEELSRRDFLTGLANRRGLEDALVAELGRQSRFGRSMTLVLWDCDGFKSLNDQQGHQAGDAALVAVADCLRSQVRTYDTVARLGGDEFVVLLVETDLLDAEPILERLRTALRFVIERQFPPLTVSAGVVVFRQSPADSAQCLALVDAAMYRAKRRGHGETEIDLYEGEQKSDSIPFPVAQKAR